MYDVSRPAEVGRVIAFWSPIHRQGAVSTTAALVASMLGEKLIAEKEGNKVLLMNNELMGAPTAANYMTNEQMPDGLTEVVELSNSENLNNATDIYNNTFSGLPSIDILNSSKRNTSIGNYLHREIPRIFDVARSGYKYTVVDTVPGLFDESTAAILHNCDIIVVCMPQDRYIFDSWIRKMPGIYTAETEQKPVIIISEKHYEYDHMKYKDMQKELKRDLLTICLNDAVHKAVSTKSVTDFVHKQMESKRSHDDVIDELEEIYDFILDAVNKVVNFECEERIKEDERSQREAQEHLTDDLFFGMGYSGSEDDSSNSGSAFGADIQEDESSETTIDGGDTGVFGSSAGSTSSAFEAPDEADSDEASGSSYSESSGFGVPDEDLGLDKPSKSSSSSETDESDPFSAFMPSDESSAPGFEAPDEDDGILGLSDDKELKS